MIMVLSLLYAYFSAKFYKVMDLERALYPQIYSRIIVIHSIF